MGKKLSDKTDENSFAKKDLPQNHRVVEDGGFLTMDHNPDRSVNGNGHAILALYLIFAFFYYLPTMTFCFSSSMSMLTKAIFYLQT